MLWLYWIEASSPLLSSLPVTTLLSDNYYILFPVHTHTYDQIVGRSLLPSFLDPYCTVVPIPCAHYLQLNAQGIPRGATVL